MIITKGICSRMRRDTFYYSLWTLSVIPFGIKKMSIWLVPRNYEIGGTYSIWAINFIIGGIIGGFVIVARIIKNIVQLLFLFL